MGDVANCKLGYFTQWNDAEHSTADNASSVPYYLQCHITRTYPIFPHSFPSFIGAGAPLPHPHRSMKAYVSTKEEIMTT